MIRLSENDARTRLEGMLQAEEEPALNEGQISDLLEFARCVDRDGRLPTDDGWDPSWDLNAAAAEGWRRKAGKVAGRFNVTVDGDTLQRAQAFAACLRMAEMYAARVVVSLPLGGRATDIDVIGN